VVDRPHPVLNVSELREIARQASNGCQRATERKTEVFLAEIAFEASQLAQLLEANGALTQQELEFYTRLMERLAHRAPFLETHADKPIFNKLPK